MKLIAKYLVLVCLLFVSMLAWSQDDAEDTYESLDLSIVFDRTYTADFPSLYTPPNVVYIPLVSLFDFLKIPNKVTNDGQTIAGFFEDESNPFLVDYTKKTIAYNKQTFTLNEGEAVLDMGMLYLKTSLYKRVFGFDMVFNERALSIQFSSPFELPLFKLMKLEKKREMLRSEGGDEAIFDTTLLRKYHWFRGHMVDWNIASSQSNQGFLDSRLALGYGAEILGGETNLFLNYSTSTKVTRNQQQYSWRWADNDFKFMRQITVGRIPTQSISSVMSPVDGIVLTNASTTIRKALGTYLVEDHTDPDWVVELYINNQLISYTRADASGFYSFKVPLVYGTSNITLRFYGPNGEIRSQEKLLSMPFNLMPKGEFEYSITGGSLLDSTSAKFARAQMHYGLARTLTLGAGMEYLSTIPNNSSVPFLNVTFQPFSRMLFTGEYAHKVRFKTTMNVFFPGNIVADATFAKYVPGQDAIIYNYLQERALSVNVPFRVQFWNSSLRTSVRQNVYSDFSFTSGELTWSNSIKNYSLIWTNYANSSSANALNMYANLTFGTKIMNLNIRASAQYNYMFDQLISVRAEMDRKVFKNGYASVKFENNFLTNSSGVNLAFRYEFPFMMTNASTSISRKNYQFSQGASGSFAFNSGDKYVHVSNRNAVGRSGISIMPFVDVNFNGKRDKNEPISKGMRVRSSGGQVLVRDNDSIIRIVGLEPFVDYSLILDESGFENVALKSSLKNMKVITDPNQFKFIELPILPMAEISGSVLDENGNGLGRIIVHITDSKGQEVSKLLTESDGFFNYLGFKPGAYKVSVDSAQMNILKYKADPLFATVAENPNGDMVNAGDIQLMKLHAVLPKVEVADTLQKPIPAPVPQQAFEEDTLALFVLYFDVNKTQVKPEYNEQLLKLAHYLNKPEHELLGIDIQGHTDTDASEGYNLVLSQRRAAAVRQILIQYGVRSERLKTSAFGMSKQASHGKDSKDKALSRRVVFKPIKVTDKAERPIEEILKSGKIASIYLKPPHLDVQQKMALSAEHIMQRYVDVPDWCLMFRHDDIFMFQVAAFDKPEQAMQFAETLLPFNAEKVIVVNQGVYVKVQLGYYNNLDDAMKDATALYAKGFIK